MTKLKKLALALPLALAATFNTAAADENRLYLAVYHENENRITELLDQGDKVTKSVLSLVVEGGIGGHIENESLKRRLVSEAVDNLSDKELMDLLFQAAGNCQAEYSKYILEEARINPNRRHLDDSVRPRYAFTLALSSASIDRNSANFRNKCLDTVRTFEEAGADFDLVRFETSYGQPASRTLGLLEQYPNHVFK